jgi:hypothetical protein
MPTSHILCHMLICFNGKAVGDFLALPEVAPTTRDSSCLVLRPQINFKIIPPTEILSVGGLLFSQPC